MDGEVIALMTVSDVAEILAVSKSMVYKLVEEREIPFVKIGKILRFKREDVEAWIESQRIEAQATKHHNAEIAQDVDKILSANRIEAQL